MRQELSTENCTPGKVNRQKMLLSANSLPTERFDSGRAPKNDCQKSMSKQQNIACFTAVCPLPIRAGGVRKHPIEPERVPIPSFACVKSVVVAARPPSKKRKKAPAKCITEKATRFSKALFKEGDYPSGMPLQLAILSKKLLKAFSNFNY